MLIVDTTNASSGPVAEWALALALVGLREHARFRDIIGGKTMSYADYWTNPPARELTDKRVGMIGFGHIAWRLRELLAPFGCRYWPTTRTRHASWLTPYASTSPRWTL